MGKVRKTVRSWLGRLKMKLTGNLENEIIVNRLLLGRLLSNSLKGRPDIQQISDAEFQVFSQWGDDGIIQYLIQRIDIANRFFVEFGVSNYRESNTRFLLINNNWSGLIMDGSKDNIDFIQQDEIYWKYNITAKTAFLTAENINDLIQQEGIKGDIGLLHIDIDGNDYWVWKAITMISPVIVIVEYNSLLGIEKPLTIPYNPKFFRGDAHYSYLYSGASLLSLWDLSEEKGYAFIGCNSAGNNAYFIRKDKLGPLKPLTISEGFNIAQFRESRRPDGQLAYLNFQERVNLLKGLEFYNTRTNQLEKFV